jgi:superfamily I DNA and/or RNA helicase
MTKPRDLESWLQHLRAAWRAEENAHASQTRNRLHQTEFKDRVADGVALAGLRLVDEEPVGERLLAWFASTGGDVDGFEGRPGEPVVLWSQTPEHADSVQGALARRQPGRIGIIIDPDALERVDDRTLRLDLLDNPVTFQRGHAAITRAGSAVSVGRRTLLQTLAGLRPMDIPRERAPESWFDPALNASQQMAVIRGLAADPVALIQGPPGTGKTRTAAELVRQAVAKGWRVFVSAPSNLAVDNLCERIDSSVVRVGPVWRVSPTVEELTLEARVHRHPTWDALSRWLKQAHERQKRLDQRIRRGAASRDEIRSERDEIRSLRRDAAQQRRSLEQAILSSAPVVAATPAAVPDGLDLGEFQLVVMDEAAQCLTPLLLAALRADRLVLVGDHCQLPPTVVGQGAALDLEVTTFEQLALAQPGMCTMLDVQHRMHPQIAEFPAQRMYGGRLHNAVGMEARVLPAPVTEDLMRPQPVAFVDAAGAGWTEDSSSVSTANPLMADRTAAEVVRLLERGVLPAQISVITPYRAQRELLRQRLHGTGVEAGTIDAFQGRENDVVVIDLVRSNDDGRVGFLADIRRMNVAMTRARCQLVVIGDSATITTHAFYADWVDWCHANGAWVSVWEDG